MRGKDMYLPEWLLGFGVFLIAAACACIVLSIKFNAFFIVGFVGGLVLGAAAILCWKNQWIEMTDDNSFVYSTMFGNRKEYKFYQIEDVKFNADSVTIITDNGKIHIESCAVLSDRFQEALIERINPDE